MGCFYANSKHNEAQVLTLRVERSKPFGYFMRASTAFSKEAGYADQNWFQKAAVLTGYWALQYLDISDPPISEDRLNADNLFNDSISAMILNRDDALKYGIEHQRQIDAHLFSLGFMRVTLPNAKEWIPGKHAANRLANSGKNLNFLTIPLQTIHQKFLDEIFTKFIPQSTLPLARFFYFYQVIELLMEEIADASINASLARLTEYKENHNASLFRKEAQALQGAFKESARLNKLFGLPKNLPQEFSLLKAACEKTLRSIGSTIGNNTAELLYDVRNQMFHNYRFSGAAFEDSLPEINELLEVVIPDLLIEVLAKRSHIAVEAVVHLTMVDVASSEMSFGQFLS
ncbi:MAG: hypothetical protein CFE44_13375 [Burkholderiales bacterium PBB4]|nr:MAG: hypothetical protein CFE44_13375 [Burkholderiales bacterium PBB4]